MLKRAHLKCTACTWADPDAIFERNDGPPPCEMCGAATVESMDWSVGTPSSLAFHGCDTNFARRDYGAFGVATTPAEEARIHKILLADKPPGTTLSVTSDSPQQRKERSDAARQRAIDQRKAKGITEQAWADLKKERKKVTAEAQKEAERKGENPTTAKSSHEISTIPASKL